MPNQRKSAVSFAAQLLIAAFLLFTSANLASAQITFSNTAAITINDSSAPPTPATPYPSEIVVNGFASGTVTNVSVTLKGFYHAYPDDVDILLVAPNGVNFVLFSDVGGGNSVSNLNITLDDAATTILPDLGPLTSGTFKPTNVVANDSFPGPTVNHPGDDAAPGGSATFASKFNGMNSDLVNGTWKLYVVDDETGDSGSITGGWSISFSGVSPAPAPLIISELRLRGPSGDKDEFVEIYNNSDARYTVLAEDSSAGFAVAAADNVIRFIIPNGTEFPPRGHYLGTNTAYSLSGYAFGDIGYSVDIPGNAGVALFNTSNRSNFNLISRLDAVGATSTTLLYKEGTGYPTITPFSIDYSLARKANVGTCSAATVDTNDNANDFLFVDTNATDAGAGRRLGAPGPQNLASPVNPNSTTTGGFAESRIDPNAAFGASPNTLRDITTGSNATYGKLVIRRKFTNNTGSPITRLRFRVTDITTLPAAAGQTDLRALSSADITALTISGGATVRVSGTTLEQPPNQPLGGGFNSSFSVNGISAVAPLAPGASVNVQFVYGIEQQGSFSIAQNIESLPVGDKNQAFIYRGATRDISKINAATLASFNEPCILGATAASVAVGGRVTTSAGRGIRNVMVTLTDSEGVVRTATTGSFGYYHFENVAAGDTYVVSAQGKRYTFAQSSKVLNVEEDKNDVDFTGVETGRFGN